MLTELLPALKQSRVVLASSSPRRIELVEKHFGIRPTVVVSNFAEDFSKRDFATAAEYCRATAITKGIDVAKRHTPAEFDYLVAADSIVVDLTAETVEAAVIEKAATATEADHFIHRLRGRRHAVHTAVVVIVPLSSSVRTKARGGEEEEPSALTDSGASLSSSLPPAETPRVDVRPGDGVVVYSAVETTWVTFAASISDADIASYVADYPSAWKGKAGAYGIQDVAALWIEGIAGDYYNVMGLPVRRLATVLALAVS